jgi:hypothetical protein
MKEVRYWEADDGEKFESEEDCIEYERDCLWGELLETVPCYTSDYRRITKEDAEMYACDVAYILIPSAESTFTFNDAYEVLDGEFFYDGLPYLGKFNSSGDLAYRDDSNVWHVWSEEMALLREMAERFQLFEEKSE